MVTVEDAKEDEVTAPPAAGAVTTSKTPMEESADALAGVEGALTGGKRKGAAAPGAPPKKRAAKATKAEPTQRPRSNSIEKLAEVAGTLLTQDMPGLPSLPAAGAAGAVPDPMAAPAANNGGAAGVMAMATIVAHGTAAAPTGFRKKGAAKAPPAAAAKPAAAKAAAAAAAAAKRDADLSSSKKTQITYNPDIPMTKEQLTAWRREMRRVRNRESAAASRRKVRDRIEELEDEVAIWKKRYEEVMARLGSAEKKKKKSGKDDE